MNLNDIKDIVRRNWKKITNYKDVATLDEILDFLNIKRDSVLYKVTKHNLPLIHGLLEKVDDTHYKLIAEYDTDMYNEMYNYRRRKNKVIGTRDIDVSGLLSLVIPIDIDVLKKSASMKNNVELKGDELKLCDSCHYYDTYSSFCTFYGIKRHPKMAVCSSYKRKYGYKPKHK